MTISLISLIIYMMINLSLFYQVVSHEIFTTSLMLGVEIYLLELKLAKFPDVETSVSREFSKKDTLGEDCGEVELFRF